jgi:hypothetical protein
MQNKKYTIRTVHRKEVEIAIEWAEKEGWNPGLKYLEGRNIGLGGLVSIH